MFRQLFEEGLQLQKLRVREQRAYAKEQRLEHQRRHQDQIESLENYYKDQVRYKPSTKKKKKAIREINWLISAVMRCILFPLSFHYLLKNLQRSDRRSRLGKKLKKR